MFASPSRMPALRGAFLALAAVRAAVYSLLCAGAWTALPANCFGVTCFCMGTSERMVSSAFFFGVNAEPLAGTPAHDVTAMRAAMSINVNFFISFCFLLIMLIYII